MSTYDPKKPLAVPVDRALEAIGLKRTKFYELVAEGRIKTVKIGRRTLVVWSSLEALIASEAA